MYRSKIKPALVITGYQTIFGNLNAFKCKTSKVTCILGDAVLFYHKTLKNVTLSKNRIIAEKNLETLGLHKCKMHHHEVIRQKCMPIQSTSFLDLCVPTLVVPGISATIWMGTR